MAHKQKKIRSGKVDRLKNQILQAEINAREVNRPIRDPETPAAVQRRVRSAQRWKDRAKALRKQLQVAKTQAVRSRQKPKHV